ncbi:MAG: DUF2513 domain-containing protein [Holophaga sp.]|jgi:hypothetical protein
MKRDWDLVRIILQTLEARSDGYLNSVSVPDYDPGAVAYHFQIMNDAGLIEATVQEFTGGTMFGMAIRLKWQGHEFLDSIRTDKVWDKVKQSAWEKGIDLTFDIAGKLAGKVMKEMLGLPD